MTDSEFLRMGAAPYPKDIRERLESIAARLALSPAEPAMRSVPFDFIRAYDHMLQWLERGIKVDHLRAKLSQALTTQPPQAPAEPRDVIERDACRFRWLCSALAGDYVSERIHEALREGGVAIETEIDRQMATRPALAGGQEKS